MTTKYALLEQRIYDKRNSIDSKERITFNNPIEFADDEELMFWVSRRHNSKYELAWDDFTDGKEKYIIRDYVCGIECDFQFHRDYCDFFTQDQYIQFSLMFMTEETTDGMLEQWREKFGNDCDEIFFELKRHWKKPYQATQSEIFYLDCTTSKFTHAVKVYEENETIWYFFEEQPMHTKPMPDWDKEPHRVPVTVEEIASKKAWRKNNPSSPLSRAKALLHDLEVREMAEYSTSIPHKSYAYLEYNLDENDEWFRLYQHAYERIKAAMFATIKEGDNKND